jgi:hypothetical protein
VIAANIGPAHGVHTNPKAEPSTAPLQNPELTLRDLLSIAAPKEAIRPELLAKNSPRDGKISTIPKAAITAIAIERKKSGDMPKSFTRAASARVKKVKLAITPHTTPRGRKRPLPAPAANKAGSTGSTQGDSTVATPARKAKSVKTSIRSPNMAVFPQPSTGGTFPLPLCNTGEKLSSLELF